MNVPKLRFKEFHTKWESSKLGGIVSFSKGKGISKSDITEDGENPCIRYGELYTQYGSVINDTISYTNIQKSDSVLSKSGDVIIPASGETQLDIARAACVLKDGVILGGDLNILSHKQNGIWLAYYLESAKKLEIAQLSQGHTVVHLYASQLKELNVNVPSVEEQTKIATFLSAVDGKIAQLNRKHELLQQYKQGMMQQLFSQKLRFKDDKGEDFPEWEEKVLIEVVDSNIKWGFTGGPFGSNLKSEDFTPQGVRVIQLQNIGDGAFLNEYRIYTSFSKADELLSSNIFPNEILISKMGDPVARCCIVPEDESRYVMCSDGIRLVVDKKRHSHLFIFYQINFQDFRQKAAEVSTGSTRKRIGLNDLKQLPVYVPCLEEQTKIATCLNTIDARIDTVARQLQQAREWKQGLLQQMFV